MHYHVDNHNYKSIKKIYVITDQIKIFDITYSIRRVNMISHFFQLHPYLFLHTCLMHTKLSISCAVDSNNNIIIPSIKPGDI